MTTIPTTPTNSNPEMDQSSSRFLSLDEKWGTQQHTSPTCLSEFPFIADPSTLLDVVRTTSNRQMRSQEQCWTQQLPRAPIREDYPTTPKTEGHNTALNRSSMSPRRSSMKQPGQRHRATIQWGAEREVILPITGERVKRRRSITFDEIVILQPVTPVSKLTKKPEALWFQEEDLTESLTKSQRLVEAVESGRAADLGRKPCLRGLEGLREQGLIEKKELRYDGWNSVFEEQRLQIHQRIFDEEAISNVYQRASSKGHELAASRARQDEKAVQSYLKSTRRMCRRLSC